MDFLDPITDDPQIVDKALYEEHLKEHEGEIDNSGNDFFLSFADLDNNHASPSFIGKKWLVPLWYHV